jgi:hypothetical protein
MSRLSHHESNSNDGRPRSPFHAELSRLTELFEAADTRAKRAANITDREQYEAERSEVMEDFHACNRDLADLFLLLLRKAVDHDREAVRVYLVSLLRPELSELADNIARMEAHR